MDERKKKVLHAIINDYIVTAEPVGSRTISKKYEFGVSPATIRNEMADLEELGYIEQPHTSAGRIPSDKGYRYYVDCLMEKEKLELSETNFIQQSFSKKITEFDNILQQTTQMLSQLTNYTSLIIVPKTSRGRLEKFQLVPINPYKVLAIIVTDTGFINHRVLDLPEYIEPSSLEKTAEILQNKLYGLNTEQVNLTLLREISHELERQKQLVDLTLELMEQAMFQRGEERVYLGGALNMLNQPEFQDINKIKALLSLLEEEEIVKKILKKKHNEGVEISIGGELPCELINNCSVITATYRVNGKFVGTVGVLGPTRMTYSKAYSLVEVVTDQLSEVLTQMFRK